MKREMKEEMGAPPAQSKRALIAAVIHLRLVGAQMATFIEEQMPLFCGASTEFDGAGEPTELLERWHEADAGADKTYGAADRRRRSRLSEPLTAISPDAPKAPAIRKAALEEAALACLHDIVGPFLVHERLATTIRALAEDAQEGIP